jgi:lipopolysaccharide/colanic/teichoic acid biosynthesis glycosyltransferase
MRLRRFDLSGPETIVKRLVDLVGAAAGLVLLAPLLAVMAVAVKLTSPGPAIFRSERVGRYGRRFRMYKFRTMLDGNDSRAHEQYLRAHIRDGRPAEITESGVRIYKPRNDPRVTPLGAWLRKLSLDELPQLYNVLRGEMSLVGPRPCLPYEWDLYQPWQRRRLDVKPGCTGLWQVTGRSRVRFEDMVMLDLVYAHNSTLLGDFKLIAQTIPVMVQGKGAY